MQIWVDADACPSVVKDILFRAADRLKITVTLVANRMLKTPPSPWIKAIQVPQGFDVADNRITELAQAGDLVITADIPLAAQALGKGALVIDPRGDAYTANNIEERLSIRKFMEEVRASGVSTGGPAPYSNADGKAFADRLDRLLTKLALSNAR
ncbi:MAG: YaiI/YqxD family protein, partial [Burkholderiales bacterium]